MFLVATTIGILAAAHYAAPAADTIGVLRAVVAQMAAQARAGDSTRRVRCAEASRSTCPPEYPRPPVWYADERNPSASRVAKVFAGLDSVEFSTESRLPMCPWPANAPTGSGYQSGVDVEFEGDTAATVTVRLRCDNPPGYLHDIFAYDRTYSVTRTPSGWSAQLILTRIT